MALGTCHFLRQRFSDLEYDWTVSPRAPAEQLMTLDKFTQSKSIQPTQHAVVAMVMVYQLLDLL